jgi:hypothetical protein
MRVICTRIPFLSANRFTLLNPKPQVINLYEEAEEETQGAGRTPSDQERQAAYKASGVKKKSDGKKAERPKAEPTLADAIFSTPKNTGYKRKKRGTGRNRETNADGKKMKGARWRKDRGKRRDREGNAGDGKNPIEKGMRMWVV